MVAGPWFAVVDEESGFIDFGSVWLSDGGSEDGAATLQLSVRLVDPPGAFDAI